MKNNLFVFINIFGLAVVLTSFMLITLLSNDFLKLVIVGVIVASPLAWFIINKWLQKFCVSH